jgi:hypothetical protein
LLPRGRDRPWVQVVVLLVLAPVAAEYLAAYDDSTGDLVRLVDGLVVFAPLDGCPALLAPLGISAYSALNFLSGHAVYSMAAAIAMAEGIRPVDATRPWLRRPALVLVLWPRTWSRRPDQGIRASLPPG